MESLFDNEIAEQVFYRCVEDCFEPVMITDRKGVLKYVNPAWCLTYGYTREEALGQTPRLLRTENQDDKFYREMWATILNPQIGFWRGEVLNRAKDGHVVPVLLTITPYRQPMGEIVGYMGIAVDLSDHKQMEQQILRQDRLASIGMLAGGLAHEIGNPLGVMRGRAELLLKQVKDNAAAEKNATVIIGQIDRISGLIQSLLRISRIPDKVLLRPMDLAPILQEVATLMGEACRRAEIDFRMKEVDCRVLAEPSYLQQLFLNLVINSTHAIEEQKTKGTSALLKAPGERHSIEISSKSEENGRICAIEVRDTGCGISAEHIGKLFQPFFTTKAAGQGTGMGLAIVLKLVEEMQGQVSVESSGPGLGAKFTVRLRAPSSS